MPTHPSSSIEAPLGDRALYRLCQLLGWSGVAALYVAFDTLSLETLGWVTVICVTGWSVTHALHLLATRGAWMQRPVGYWLPRLVTATVAGGLLWWFVTDVGYGLVLSEQTLAESVESTLFGDFLGLNRLTALIHLFIVALWSALYVAAHAFRRYRAVEVIAWQRQAELRGAELQALHARLNPHFLFNALNSLRALIDEQPAQARDATTRLARLLRYTLRTSQVETVALDAELEAVRDYLALEALRHEDRLHVEISGGGDAGTLRVPPLAVLTLVENAVKHGIAPRPEGGIVTIAVEAREGQLRVRVANPGQYRPAATQEGYGLHTVRERLALLYHDRAALSVASVGGDVVATLQLPVEAGATTALYPASSAPVFA